MYVRVLVAFFVGVCVCVCGEREGLHPRVRYVGEMTMLCVLSCECSKLL